MTDTRRDTQRQYSKRTRRKRRKGMLDIVITLGLMAMAAIALTAPTNKTEQPKEDYYDPMEIHYSAEREEYLRQERIRQEQEGEALRKAIEEYNERCQRQAEEEWKAYMEELHNSRVIYAPGDLDGFIEWEIPEEYQRYGGEFSVDLQQWLYSNCKDANFDYATALALIETESGYKQNSVGEAGDTGLMQVIEQYNKERMATLGAYDLADPYDNIQVGVSYLGELLEKYDGNYGKALTAYNCGPDGAYKYYFSAGVDTNRYAKKILARAEEIRQELEDR